MCTYVCPQFVPVNEKKHAHLQKISMIWDIPCFFLILIKMSSREQVIEVIHDINGWFCCSQTLDNTAHLRGQEARPSEEEVRRVEEERIQVLNNMEELEQKIKELDNQVEESAREVKRKSSDVAVKNINNSVKPFVAENHVLIGSVVQGLIKARIL